MAGKKKKAKKSQPRDKAEPKSEKEEGSAASQAAAVKPDEKKTKAAKKAKKKKKSSKRVKGEKKKKLLVQSKIELIPGAQLVSRKEIAALATQIGAISDPEKLHASVRFILPSQCTPLDAILGGGWYGGRIHEIIGEYSTGKSSVLEHAVASAQSFGGLVLFISAESAIDLDRMTRIGCNVGGILWNETDSIVEGFKSVEEFLLNAPEGPVLLIGWDTIGACHPADTRPGSGAREVREALRRIPTLVSLRQAVFIFVNQTAVTFNMFETEPANPRGGGIRFHATARIILRGKKRLDRDGRILGETTGSAAGFGIMPTAQALKNKKFPPFRKARIPIMFDAGIDDDTALWHYFDGSPFFVKSGGWVRIKYGENQFSQPFQYSCWRQVLAETEGLRPWLKQQAIQLAYQGYDPVKR